MQESGTNNTINTLMGTGVFDNGNGSGIDIVRILRALVRKIWAVIMVGVLFAAAGYFFARSTYVEVYTVKATLEFTTTEYIKVSDEKGTEELVTVIGAYKNNDADRYRYKLKSDVVVNMLVEATGGKYTAGQIKNAIAVTNESVTSFFNIQVTGTDPQFCTDVMDAILDVFPDFLRSSASTLGITLVNYPTAPYVSNSDNAVRVAIAAFFVGAVIIIAIVVFIEIFSDTVKDIDDIRNKTELPVIGTIPYVGKTTGLFNKQPMFTGGLLVTDEEKVTFAFVECFKSIRAKIESLQSSKGYKTFIVTSTYENEGKTTVAVNIACTLAQKGKSVLLIDGDLRKPAVLKTIGVKYDEQSGLIPIIKGESTYEKSIKFVKSLGLFILPSGGITQKSAEILDADKVREVLEKARKEFDYIIIDTPPTRVVSDSLVISTLSDAMIFVVRKDHAKIGEINETIEEISGANIDIAGAVFTMNDEESKGRILNRGYGLRSRRYYYRGGNYYGDNYGYGNGYGSSGYGYGSSGYGYGNSGYGYGSSGYGYGNSGYGYGYGTRRRDGYGYGYGFFGRSRKNKHSSNDTHKSTQIDTEREDQTPSENSSSDEQ